MRKIIFHNQQVSPISNIFIIRAYARQFLFVFVNHW
jgi:hypothetical protein